MLLFVSVAGLPSCLTNPAVEELVLYVDLANEGNYQDGSFTAPYASFQEALKEVKNLAGRRLVLAAAPGVYEESLNLFDFNDGLTIRSQGDERYTLQSSVTAVEIRNSSSVQISDAMIISDGDTALSLTDSKNISLENISLSCALDCITAADSSTVTWQATTAEAAGRTASFANVDNLVIKNIEINGGTAGIEVTGSDGLDLSESRFTGQSVAAVVLTSTPGVLAGDLEVSTAVDSADGIVLDSVFAARIFRFNLSGPAAAAATGRGVALVNCDDPQFINSTISGYGSAVSVSGGSDVDLSLLTLSSSATGLEVKDQAEVQMIESTLDGHGLGVDAANSDVDIIYTGITNSNTYAVVVNDDLTNENSLYKIRGSSVISGNQSGGLYFYAEGFAVRVTSVTFSNNGGYAISAPAQSDVTKFECSRLTLEAGESIDPALSSAGGSECL